MTATDELRKMLDERGVEHCDFTECTLWLKDGFGYRASADEGLSGFMHLRLWCTTPEQAIEATLGRGTCHNTQSDFDFMCSECGKCVDNGRVLGFNYCPNCGRKVMT